MFGRRLLWVIAVLIPVLGWSQNNRFDALLQSAPSERPEQATLRMNQFIADLQEKRDRLKSDEAFLRHTFRQVHKTFLTNYKAYSQFPEIFDSGNYDCLSATSLFSLVLDAFGFEYKIIETNYHIFMMVEGDNKQMLLESTDKVNGFASDDRIIKERIKNYQENKMLTATSSDKYYYQYHLDLYEQVTPQQLTGLLYFNQAVSAFNKGELVASAQKLKKAMRIYDSPRIAEFALILVTKIADSELGYEEKKQLICPFASHIKARAEMAESL